MYLIPFLSFRFLRCLEKWRRRRGYAKRRESSANHMAKSDQAHIPATTLERFPVEILQYIARFLTPDSAACFVLCSKSLLWAIGNQSWLALRTKDQRTVKLRFLDLLQRDLREWLPCYHCAKLHLFDLKPDPPTTWWGGI